MTKVSWQIALVLAIAVIAVATAMFFRVDSSTYTLVEQSESLRVNTDELLTAPNGRRPQDTNGAPNDATFGTVLPYFAAPHQ